MREELRLARRLADEEELISDELGRGSDLGTFAFGVEHHDGSAALSRTL